MEFNYDLFKDNLVNTKEDIYGKTYIYRFTFENNWSVFVVKNIDSFEVRICEPSNNTLVRMYNAKPENVYKNLSNTEVLMHLENIKIK